MPPKNRPQSTRRLTLLSIGSLSMVAFLAILGQFFAYNQQAQVGLQQLRLVEYGLLGLTRFGLLLKGILIFRPAVEFFRLRPH